MVFALVTDQLRDQVLGLRAAHGGGEIVAGAGGVGVAAGDEVVVVAGVGGAGGRGVLGAAGEVPETGPVRLSSLP
jgi:hypothetical protein